MTNLKKYREVIVTDKDSSNGIAYVGKARIPSGMSLTEAMAKPMWSIVKYVDTTGATVVSTQHYPKDDEVGYSPDMSFVWNNRAILTRDS